MSGMKLLAAVVAALVLTVADTAGAAPREGRWVGVSETGMQVSFTIQSHRGRQYIANKVRDTRAPRRARLRRARPARPRRHASPHPARPARPGTVRELRRPHSASAVIASY